MAAKTTTADAHQLAISGETRVGKWLLIIASASALGAGLLFLAGLSVLRDPYAGSLLTQLGNNWLVTIFRLLAGDAGIQASELYRLNALDLILLLLIAVTQAGLYHALHTRRRTLALIALVQPPLGMLLFLLTHSAGRCAVMGAGLVISVAMLISPIFSKWTGWMGLLASILLLAGDFGTASAPNSILAITTGVGYILLTGWLFVVARRLLQLTR